MLRTMLAAALLAFTVAPALTLAQPARTVDLRPRWVKGAESRLVLKIDQRNTTTSALGQGDSEQVVTQELTLRERVLDSDPESGATVELLYERIKYKVDADVGAFDFDSAGSGAPAKPQPPKKNDGLDFLDEVATAGLEPYLKKVAGTKLTVKFDGSGNITSVEGGENLRQGGVMGPAGGLTPDAKGLAGLFGPIGTMTKGQASRVKVGDKWTYTDALDLQPLGGLKMVTQHTLKAVRGDLAEVLFTGSIEPQSAAPTSPFKIQQAAYSGAYQWDTRAARLKSLSTDQQTTIEALGAQGVTMKSRAKMTVERSTGKLPPIKAP